MLEAILCALLLSLGLLPLVAAVARRASYTVATLVVLFWVSLAGIGIRQSMRPDQAAQQLAVDARPVKVLADGYVSSNTCQKCHPRQYESWHRSYHRTMTQVASPESRAQSVERAVDLWSRATKATPGMSDDAVLIERGGALRKFAVRRLLESRDDRRVYLKE